MLREVPDQNVCEAYRSLVFRYGSRDAHGETALLIKVLNFNFGDIDAMDTKFEEFNLLIKEHDDVSGKDNTPDTIKRAILVAIAPELLWTHLLLKSQVIHNLPRDASGTQSVPQSAQRFQTHGAR